MNRNTKHLALGIDINTDIWGIGIIYLAPYNFTDRDYKEIHILILCVNIYIKF